MQDIINKIQSGDITDNQLLKALTDYENKTVDEYNEIVDAVEAQNNVIDQQAAEIKRGAEVLEKQHLALLKTEENKKIFLANEESLKKQSIQFQVECKNLKHQISVLKKETKAQKEQTKRNKQALKVRDEKIKRLEKSKGNKFATDKLQELNCIYSKGKDVLLIYPSLLTADIDGVRKRQVSLLYTNRNGCFVTAFLDKDNKVCFSHFINDDADISERTRSLINKNTMRVSSEAAEFAENWLYRVNVVNGGLVDSLDLMCHKD